ncbi:Hypothetical protein PHPALM_36384 [Phytophthora palmivora]|uniref:Uncharacterized protein n=1 Tax=Phytophthora palmivora TaxID=4796 RepID=A0A2P4X036_9STRA|nr:Hypothetical protein PHPALM_36384 [Phytophthora palmivora]
MIQLSSSYQFLILTKQEGVKCRRVCIAEIGVTGQGGQLSLKILNLALQGVNFVLQTENGALKSCLQLIIILAKLRGCVKFLLEIFNCRSTLHQLRIGVLQLMDQGIVSILAEPRERHILRLKMIQAVVEIDHMAMEVGMSVLKIFMIILQLAEDRYAIDNAFYAP